MSQIPSLQDVAIKPWICVLLVTCAGAIGGLLNAYMSDNGFALPTRIKGVWRPGACGTFLWVAFLQ
jgi:hypothetical protein